MITDLLADDYCTQSALNAELLFRNRRSFWRKQAKQHILRDCHGSQDYSLPKAQGMVGEKHRGASCTPKSSANQIQKTDA
jgi:hypothetical protein